MASTDGPFLVTDNLSVLLDPLNPRSYPGSGTVWTDLSGQINNQTFQNSGFISYSTGVFTTSTTGYFNNSNANGISIAGSIITKVLTITSGTSWTVPIDWNNTNTISVIGGGGGGATANSPNKGAGGGGGGAYSQITNLTLTPRTATSIAVGAGGGIASAGGGTWFNGTGLLAASVSAAGGSPGTNSNPGGSGGQASAGIGSIKFSGGSGGAAVNLNYAAGGGGGGAAGSAANGVTAGTSTFNSGSNGGAGNGGTGGGGGIGGIGTGTGSTAGAPGGAGGEYTITYSNPYTTAGSGGAGGGGGGGSNNYASNAGDGGLYGAGGGGGGYGLYSQGSGGVGANGVIIISYTPIVTNTTTVAAWVKISSTGSIKTIFSTSSDTATTNGWNFSISATGYLTVIMPSNTTYTYTSASAAVATNTWLYVAVTINSTAITFYINGRQYDSATISNNMAGGAFSTTVATGAGSGNYFNGQLGVVQVYNQVLTTDQLAQNFTAYRGRYGV